ncbi:MAG: hypothetical protein JXD22_10795 [Sedimentisphaerales bacterium]|nr:hypothetical protein [Sedimentisphaerales bacterium]
METTWYGLLTRKILQEAANKTPQCSGLDKPCLLAIGTWHFSAGQVCFDKSSVENILTGTPRITMNIDKETGGAIGNSYLTTDLGDTTFVRPSKNRLDKIDFVRLPISAILLCPFGTRPTNILGLLHPKPNHPFDRKILPQIEFCRLKDKYEQGIYETEWI